MFDKKGHIKANCRIAGIINHPPYISENELLKRIYCYEPNDFGLYCMAGNAAEMVYKSLPVDTDNISQLDSNIILKGGSWCHVSFHALISSFDKYYRADKNIGFRCVCEFTK